jgi:hypothetical protein|tara:strand:+ start:250 stop:561 length:312 start_codon:yes stop_codon:yes gene_type:complete
LIHRSDTCRALKRSTFLTDEIQAPFSYGVWPDALLAVGDRLTVEGTTIEVLQTGDYDKIRFSKAALAETTATTTVPPATETAGIQDGTFATCGSFLTPNDAQT